MDAKNIKIKIERINQHVDATSCDTFIQIPCRTIVSSQICRPNNKWNRFGETPQDYGDFSVEPTTGKKRSPELCMKLEM